MKKIVIILVLFANGAYAQTWKEWTQQKKTQIKYLINQIAALQVYIGYVEKGYAIANKGLNAIHAIKKGDFSLHDEYFTSLKSVNPKIKNYLKVADIMAMQVKIIQAYHKQKILARESGQLTQREISYCNTVFTSLLNGCTDIIDQLLTLVTNGVSEIKDDERIRNIDGLHKAMKDRFAFAEHFTREANELQINRVVDANDIRVSRVLVNPGK